VYFTLFCLYFQEINDTVIRKIELRHNPTQTVRRITQYHYNRWPDFGVPSDPVTFLKLLKKVSREHPSHPDHPNIVHCSAGIGRSGTFCLVDSCIQVMNKRYDVSCKAPNFVVFKSDFFVADKQYLLTRKSLTFC